MQAIQELVDMKKAYQEELTKKGEDAIKSVFSDVFNRYAGLETIEITGIVPYFNDGDACIFGMWEPTVTYKGEEFDGEWSVKYALEKGRCTKEDVNNVTEVYKALKPLYDIEDAFQEVFGEHFRITATKDGVEVEEYTDHD